MANFIYIDDGRIRPASGTRIIKGAEYATVAPALRILDEARKKAAEIIEAAEATFQEEKQKGYEEGLSLARQEIADQMTTMKLRTGLYYQDLEAQTIRMVMAVVRKVLKDIEPRALVVAQVKNALDAFKGRKKLTIKVNPTIADSLNQRFAELMTACPELDIIDIKATPHLSADDLILESETGIVEASLETQLTAIEDAIRKELHLPN